MNQNTDLVDLTSDLLSENTASNNVIESNSNQNISTTSMVCPICACTMSSESCLICQQNEAYDVSLTRDMQLSAIPMADTFEVS